MSLASPAGQVAIACSVAGSNTSKVFPLAASTNLPSIYIWYWVTCDVRVFPGALTVLVIGSSIRQLFARSLRGHRFPRGTVGRPRYTQSEGIVSNVPGQPFLGHTAEERVRIELLRRHHPGSPPGAVADQAGGDHR